MRKLNIIGLLTIISLLLCQCGPKLPGDTDSLANLQDLARARRLGGAKMGAVRKLAIDDQALSIGAQAGLAWRAQKINKQLEQQAHYLNQIYNFRYLLLDHNVLPPVLQESVNTLNNPTSNALRLADRTYSILQQARFVTVVPSWRNYLITNFAKPARPDESMLPRNRFERRIWRRSVTQGWQNGLQQANDIFATNLFKLQQDFQGMILYHKLLAQNMVTKPYIARADLGITGDSQRMEINDQILRISAMPQLNLQHKTWRTAVTAKPDPLHYEKLGNNNTTPY